MTTNTHEQAINYDEYINSTAIFGGVKKKIFSKNFKGGTITNLCGATEIDFSNADIFGVVVLEILQGCGETKIIVPGNWHIVPDFFQFFSEATDKRVNIAASAGTDKVLMLKGASIFATVKILGYI